MQSLRTNAAREAHGTRAAAMLCSDGSFVSEHGALTPAEVELTQRQFLEFDVDGDQSISRRDFGEAMGRNDPKSRAMLTRTSRGVPYGARVPAFCVQCVPEAQGSLAWGRQYCRYAGTLRLYCRYAVPWHPRWREPQRQAKLDAMYAAVDGDGDGRVSFVEFAAMRVRKKRGISTPRGQQQQVYRFHWYLLSTIRSTCSYS